MKSTLKTLFIVLFGLMVMNMGGYASLSGDEGDAVSVDEEGDSGKAPAIKSPWSELEKTDDMYVVVPLDKVGKAKVMEYSVDEGKYTKLIATKPGAILGLKANAVTKPAKFATQFQDSQYAIAPMRFTPSRVDHQMITVPDESGTKKCTLAPGDIVWFVTDLGSGKSVKTTFSGINAEKKFKAHPDFTLMNGEKEIGRGAFYYAWKDVVLGAELAKLWSPT